MQFATGTVVDGKVIVTGAPLVEGSVVAVISPDSDAGFTLSNEQEDNLMEAVAEIERGEYVGLEELLPSLPHRK